MKTISLDDIKAAVELLKDQDNHRRMIKSEWDKLTKEQKLWLDANYGHFLDFDQFIDLMPKPDFHQPKNPNESYVNSWFCTMGIKIKGPQYSGG